jgi:DtxR family transcriptional regulator, Mn-dependent transcriptional regulator
MNGAPVGVDPRLSPPEPRSAADQGMQPITEEEGSRQVEPLHALDAGEEGVVIGIGSRVQGAQRRRLLDLGVVPGTVIRAELRSLSGDPVAYRIRGAVVALRRAQASDILIRRSPREEVA